MEDSQNITTDPDKWICTFCGEEAYHHSVEDGRHIYRCGKCLDEYLGLTNQR